MDKEIEEITGAWRFRYDDVEYEIGLTHSEVEDYWKMLKEWKGEFKDFYFKFVNPLKFRRVMKVRRK